MPHFKCLLLVILLIPVRFSFFSLFFLFFFFLFFFLLVLLEGVLVGMAQWLEHRMKDNGMKGCGVNKEILKNMDYSHLIITFSYYFTAKFFTPAFADGLSQESGRDYKFSQVSRTLLNIVVWIVSFRPPISNSSSHFPNPLGTVPKATIAINITVTLMVLSFLKSLARS